VPLNLSDAAKFAIHHTAICGFDQ